MDQIRNSADSLKSFNRSSAAQRDSEKCEPPSDEDLQETLVLGNSSDSRASFSTRFGSTKELVKQHTAKAIDDYNELTKTENKILCSIVQEVSNDSSVLST